MTIKIPETTIFGKPVKGAIERVFSRQAQQVQQTQPAPQPLAVNPNIVAHDYIQIPKLRKVISRLEVQGYNNLNWEDTHFKLNENGLYMPTIPLFMQHLMNVIEAYKSKGKKTLFDASGNPVSEKDLGDIYFHLMKDHIAVYGSNPGAWTWLDARFADDGGMKILSGHRTSKDSQGNRILKPGKTENLESYLSEDCYADLDSASRQGLLTRKSQSQSYVQGSNVYFWHPIDGRVARFYANSGGADLGCGGNPSGGYSNLGVFAVADAGQNARP